MKFQAILLLGPTGSGKSPLGSRLEHIILRGRRCHHFDFGAKLRDIADGGEGNAFNVEEIQFLRRVLAEGALLETEHSSLAARILDDFIMRRSVQADDLLILNGLPRHLEQARVIDQTVAVIGVVQLDCDGVTVAERLRRNSGGDRAMRRDDDELIVDRKLKIYEERTRPLLSHYREQGVRVLKVTVRVKTQLAEIACLVEDWLNHP